MSSARGAFVHFQVVHALILRETRTRFGEHQLGYLWAVVEPLLWIGTFWAMYALGRRQVPHGLDTLGFLATGVLAFNLFSKTVTRIGEAIHGNRALLFYPQVQPLDLVAARAALETGTLSAVFVFVMGGAAIARQEVPQVHDPLAVILGLGLAAALGTTLGLLLCSVSVVSRVVDRLRGPLLRPMLWLSGVFYAVGDLPTTARELLLYNPVLHAVELVRGGWFGAYPAGHASITYVSAWVLALGLLGLLAERLVRRRIELS